MEIPEQQYKVVAKLPSAEFQKICRDLKEFGETMQVKASKEGITFSVQGDVGAGNVMLKPRESEQQEEKVTLTDQTMGTCSSTWRRRSTSEALFCTTKGRWVHPSWRADSTESSVCRLQPGRGHCGQPRVSCRIVQPPVGDWAAPLGPSLHQRTLK